MNLGLLGGTFDPPHRGHLHLARAAREELDLDGILFVPCHRQPLKANPPEASSWHRCAMLALALSGEPAWTLCTDEVERGEVSFTADTLERLAGRMPGHDWTLLVGSDSLESLPLWHRWRDIVDLARIAAAPREAGRGVTVPPELEGARTTVLDTPALPVQSSAIRQGLRDGGDASAWLHPPVFEYIVRQRLYLGGPEFEPRHGRGEEDH